MQWLDTLLESASVSHIMRTIMLFFPLIYRLVSEFIILVLTYWPMFFVYIYWTNHISTDLSDQWFLVDFCYMDQWFLIYFIWPMISCLLFFTNDFVYFYKSMIPCILLSTNRVLVYFNIDQWFLVYFYQPMIPCIRLSTNDFCLLL